MPIKVVVVQPVVPLYNVAFFEQLAAQNDFAFTVVADLETNSQLNQYVRDRHRFDARHCGAVEWRGLSFRPGLFSLLKQLSPDVLILPGSPRDVTHFLALALWRILGRKVAVWGRFHRIGHKRFASETYMTLAGALANLVLIYGGRGAREQRERGTQPEKIRVMSTAIDESSIIAIRDSVDPAAVEQLRQDHGLSGKKVLLHVARLTDIKRPEVTLAAFESVARVRDDVALVMIGGGDLEARMKKLALKLGIAGRTLFLGPVYDEAILARWYKLADVFVMATAVGLSIHHAMTYGLPVVTDDDELFQGSEFELLLDGINGLRYQAGNIEDYASKILRILNDAELRRTLSRNAVRRIETEYTLDRKVANYCAAIRELADLPDTQLPVTHAS